MDTTGHHSLSAIGEKLLKEALKRGNHKDMRIGAFYLGNWLTDVSQTVDPVAYKKAQKTGSEAAEALKRLFDRLLDDVPSWIDLPFMEPKEITLIKDARKGLADAHEKLQKELQAFLGEGKSGKLAKKFESILRFVGYFKFVIPEDKSSNLDRMDLDCYYHVFDKRFTQYYPHEHLDRPETGPNLIAAVKAKGRLNTHTKSASPNNDLYAYLREDIKIAAGALAFLDGGIPDYPNRLSWAAGTFHPDHDEFNDEMGVSHKVADTDKAWNLHLAMLGHALHAGEDYFAHSTFVENASAALPKMYKLFQRSEDAEILARRIKEWKPGIQDMDAKWKGLANDTHIATGYFDTVDTLVSLSHVLDHVLDRPGETLGNKADSIKDYEYGKLIQDTLELADQGRKVWDDPANIKGSPGYEEKKANLAVKWLREKGGTNLELMDGSEASLNKIARLLTQCGFMSSRPQKVKDDFVQGIIGLGSVAGTVGMGFSIYKILKDITTFLEGPVAWLKGYLPDLVHDFLKKYGEVYLKRMLLEYIGSKRIGCHSLIAKDSGPELLHEAAMECAMAVHWYVVFTLTRHGRERQINVARSAEGLQSRNHLYLWEWVDWLELLEYFLGHPMESTQVSHGVRNISVSILHETRKQAGTTMSPDSLATLAKEYAPTFLPIPGGPQSMTWEVIADANFPTAGLSTETKKRQINKVLAQRKDGVLTKGGVNYAFRPGIHLVIPYQKATFPDIPVEVVQRKWWYPVIVTGYDEIKKWYDENGMLPSAPKYAHAWIAISQEEQIKLADESTSARKKAENAYK
jgi:hypothetical protein